MKRNAEIGLFTKPSEDGNIKEFKSGYIAIAGAPNVGKSTLLNKMLGFKISITSRKPQTTRNRILGVVHRASSQLVFIDTPGVHKAKSALNLRIVDTAISVMGDVDTILLLEDSTNTATQSAKILIENLEKIKKPVVLALNKIDLVDKSKLPGAIIEWSSVYNFEAIVPVSAKRGDGIEDLLRVLEKLLPVGPPFFPEDTLTDLPERFIAAEMIRERVFRLTGQEIPYSVAVTIDSFSEKKNKGIVRIGATIHVERDSQKGIIIGKKGSKLKQIGEEARKEIERLIDSRVFLELFVRVDKDWSKEDRTLRQFGY
ncbi:MAG: GTPase Era [Proteobacteria bacterium]|nr:GTPase Era [Pseudomonadota bacterium]